MDIKEFIIRNIVNHPQDIVNLGMKKYKISRPAVLKHLNFLIRSEKIHAEGKTKDRRYSLTAKNSAQSSLQASTDPDKTNSLSIYFAVDVETELSSFVRKIQRIIERYTQSYIDLRKHVGKVCMSRDQAKRILTGLNKFKRVILDFKDVSTVGQGFVDEVFRVYHNQHPDIIFTPIHMNENVAFMVKRGLPRG